jgi:TIR domain
MKIFISWAGPQSRNIADQLHKWLPYVIQFAKPFISSGDIPRGARWGNMLAEELKATEYGIICITRHNITSPWLNFEAGALSKMVGQAYVSPLLFGVESSMLQGPLSQFQATVFDKQGDDFFGLLSSINSSLPTQQQVSSEILKGTFCKWWPDLKEGIEKAAQETINKTATGYDWLYTITDLASSRREGRLGLSVGHLVWCTVGLDTDLVIVTPRRCPEASTSTLHRDPRARSS